MNFLVMPLFFLSGALFPLGELPKTISLVARVDLLSYGVDGLRGVLVGNAHFGLPTDFFFLTIIATILLIIGSYLFSKIQI
jgi:ABC-2 type transport system permease protein